MKEIPLSLQKNGIEKTERKNVETKNVEKKDRKEKISTHENTEKQIPKLKRQKKKVE